MLASALVGCAFVFGNIFELTGSMFYSPFFQSPPRCGSRGGFLFAQIIYGEHSYKLRRLPILYQKGGVHCVTYEFLKTLYNDILLMLNRLVVKRSDLAREAETVETVKAFELYYACLNGSRCFYNFQKFDVDILEKYLDPISVSRCYYDPNLIPNEYRESIVEDQAKRVVETYEEQNEYYRMLAGLPRVDDHRWIYIHGISGIPEDVPIHQMSVEQIAHLENSGELDRLKKDNPDADYLDYLGIHTIPVLDARLAKPFEILRLGVPSNASTQKMFEKEYYPKYESEKKTYCPDCECRPD